MRVVAGFSLRHLTQPKECAKHHILVKAAATLVIALIALSNQGKALV